MMTRSTFTKKFNAISQSIVILLVLAWVNKGVCQSEILKPSQEITIDDKVNMVLKDSLGNTLTYEKALELLRTGDYISVPSINEFMQLEQIIRKPRKEDDGKYKTFTDGDIVLNMVGGRKTNFRFNPGDTIPPIHVVQDGGNEFELTNDDFNKSDIILIFIEGDNSDWRYNLRPYVKLLCMDFPTVRFVLCPTSTAKFTLDSYFSKRDLKKMSNVFLAQQKFSELMSVEYYTTYVAVGNTRKVKFWVPPIPNEKAFSLLNKYLSSVKRRSE